MAAGRRWRIDELGRDDDDVVIVRRDDGIETFGRDGGERSRQGAELGGQHGRRHGVGTLTVTPAHLAVGHGEHRGDDGDAARPRHVEIGAAPACFERGGVDHRCQPPAQAVVDDEIEDLERCRPGALVAFAGADHRPQAV